MIFNKISLIQLYLKNQELLYLIITCIIIDIIVNDAYISLIYFFLVQFSC